MPDLDSLYSDDDGETATLAERDVGPARRSASGSLADIALREALGRADARAFRKVAAVVVRAPDASWVEPLKAACGTGWAHAYGRSGSSRFDDKPEKGNADVRAALARGCRVLGVSQDPDRYLPSALVLSADLVVTVPFPTSAQIARVVRAATGRAPRDLPEGVARTLSYDEIAAQIRLGDTAAAAGRRLVAAAAAKVAIDPLVASAPPFEDLVGYGAAHDWGMDLIRSVEGWRAGEIPLRAVANRNCVLASEPGLGKSTMVRSLARSTGMRLVQSSVAAWFSGNSGDLGAVIRAANSVMDAALANSPSILMLDELDALPGRDGLDPDRASWWNPVITNIMLGVEKLGADATALVAVVGATNHPERLDPALVRPGRLDRVIHLRRPSQADIVAMVRQHLAADLQDADLQIVGDLGAGATGATAAAWVSRARGRAAADRRPMTLADLLAEVAPLDDRSPALRRRACVHEAGHAVVSTVLGGRVLSASVVGSGREGGRVLQDPPDDDIPGRSGIEDVVVTLLAGRAAETVLLDGPSAGAGGSCDSDLAQATRIICELHGTLGLGGRLAHRGEGDRLVDTMRYDPLFARAVEDDLQRSSARAEALVTENRDAVERVAAALARHRAIDGDTLRAIVAGRTHRSTTGPARETCR